MKTAYLDVFAGIAGDMTLGALIDLGVEPQRIDDAVRSLGVGGFALTVSDDARHGLGGKRVEVEVTEPQPHRHLRHFEEILGAGSLPERVRGQALDAFRRLVAAEAKVHRQPPEKVHLHEVGAVDALVDVVGACLGLHDLGVDQVVCAPVVTGRGITRGQHGAIPIPGPATLELLRGVPVRQGPVEAEMTTPTGAALAVTLAARFGPLPDMTVGAVGYGVGSRSFDEVPNLLRVVVGEQPETAGVAAGSAVVLQANVDDAAPEVLGYATERLLAAGALDVWVTAATMKKGRPGHVLSVLANPADAEVLTALLFAETTTLGVRAGDVRRTMLERRLEPVETVYGTVRVKVASDGDRVVNAAPEHDDCAALARTEGVPLKEVREAALAAWRAGAGRLA